MPYHVLVSPTEALAHKFHVDAIHALRGHVWARIAKMRGEWFVIFFLNSSDSSIYSTLEALVPEGCQLTEYAT